MIVGQSWKRCISNTYVYTRGHFCVKTWTLGYANSWDASAGSEVNSAEEEGCMQINGIRKIQKMENPLQGGRKMRREPVTVHRKKNYHGVMAAEVQNVSEDFGGPVALAASLKACVEQKDWHRGRRIHLDIIRRGLLQKNAFLGNTLVNMYAKCGILAIAQEVFDNLPVRNVVSWNVLMAGYTQHGHGEAALKCLRRMQSEGLFPNEVSLLCILKACANTGALDKGQELHASIIRDGEFLEKDVILGNALVDMYSKCGSLKKAQEVFDKLPARDSVTWNAIISGLAQHGHGEQALSCFEQMQLGGFSPDAVTLVCILKACGSMGATDKGQEIHTKIVRAGLLEKDLVVGTALVDMYGKCNLLTEALEVFDRLPNRSSVSWNALLSGYAQHGYGEEALRCFERMKFEGLSPNMVTFICILKACGNIGASDKGQEIHDEIVSGGFLQKDTAVGNALIDMYAKCGLLQKAQEVLGTLVVQDVISWSALLAGYAQHEHNEEVLHCFKQMQVVGLFPNTFTFVCVLKACGSIASSDKGHKIHAEIVRKGMLEKDMVVGTALVDMYAGCGMLAEAQLVFDKLPFWDLVSWNALIARYTQQSHCEEALNCFEQMRLERFAPNVVTFVCILKACGSIGAAYKGQEIHSDILRVGLLEEEPVLGTALVDVYANCGMLREAHEVFKKLPVKNVVVWNALLAGFSQIGMDKIVFDLFGRMIGDGKAPDAVTFTLVLNTCSHTGLLDIGQMFFSNIKAVYGISPTLEHHSCMVDLFGRAGNLDKALTVIREMPFFANLTVWHTFLGACQRWGNKTLGKLAFEHAAHLDEKDVAAYVCMSNIYATSGWHEEDME